MQFPEEYKYSKEHTWLLAEGNTGKIGITQFAQSELGQIVYVELPDMGKSFKKMRYTVKWKRLKLFLIYLCLFQEK